MSDIRSKPATDAYRDGWERAFGKKAERAEVLRRELKRKFDETQREVERRAQSLLRRHTP